MGLQDREYMNRPAAVGPLGLSWPTLIAVGVLLLGLAAAAIWKSGGIGGLFNGPIREGSLIVNINTATEQQLASLPGIGLKRAAEIVAGRPYQSVDDLQRLPGIGDRTLQHLRPYVTTVGDTHRR
jgi:competence ComEA-like helix-hairpin-helix protein